MAKPLYHSRFKKKGKKIIVDMGNIKSIKSAERAKSKAENAGLNLIKTEQIGFDKWRFTYR